MPIASKLDKECQFPASQVTNCVNFLLIQQSATNKNSITMSQIQKLGSLGAMGILVPSDYGGAGLDTAALSIAVQEISRYYICFCTSSTHNLRPVETIIRRFFHSTVVAVAPVQ